MKKIILLVASIAMILGAYAQDSRECIKHNIYKSNKCKSVALTQNNGNAMTFENNKWFAVGCPNNFTEALYELEVQEQEIQDIHLTELGRWVVLYNTNETRSDLLYENLKQKISDCQKEGEKITTITFNDSGDWIIVTAKQISASSDELVEWIQDGCDSYGQVWTACVTDDATIVVYQHGFKYLGKVPESLKEAIRACEGDIYTVKLSGDAWFFRCTDGKGCYHL